MVLVSDLITVARPAHANLITHRHPCTARTPKNFRPVCTCNKDKIRPGIIHNDTCMPFVWHDGYSAHLTPIRYIIFSNDHCSTHLLTYLLDRTRHHHKEAPEWPKLDFGFVLEFHHTRKGMPLPSHSRNTRTRAYGSSRRFILCLLT
jgi:hypothetical protein